ncbi:FIST signal transduction protein, partial [Hydrogenophaga sp. OTU3427]|uniref:FIST signal transduction protein n=1 Tax=Hydrogenophaga sp. OTU3427 TaxID=3043856 RepID=UPI00313D02AC
MKRFAHAHATHPQWRMAAALVLAQLRAQLALPEHAGTPGLALLYVTDHYADDAGDILDHLSAELPEVTDWAGTVGVGIAATGVEYFDEPALAVMLCDLAPDQYRVFSGVAPLPAAHGGRGGFSAQTALLHADATTPDVAELIAEMAERTGSGYVFGGLASSRGQTVQFALGSAGHLRGQGAASGLFHGGLSGVAFGPEVAFVSRVTQGAHPVGRSHQITAADRNVVLKLDGEPALDVMLDELGISLDQPQTAMTRLRQTLVGLTLPETERPGAPAGTPTRPGAFGSDVLVRHLIGLDPMRRGIAVADVAPVDARLAFCERHVAAARADLVRVCAEVREELEPEALSVEAAALAGAAGAARPPPGGGG